MSLSMPIENSLCHARIGIFNLNRTCIKKLEVPRLLQGLLQNLKKVSNGQSISLCLIIHSRLMARS